MPKFNTVTLTMYIFAVAALKDEAVIGHVPQKISAACSMFLHHGGSTWSQVAKTKPIRQFYGKVTREFCAFCSALEKR